MILDLPNNWMATCQESTLSSPNSYRNKQQVTITMPFRRKSGKTEGPRFQAGDRVYKAKNGNTGRKDGIIVSREDINYKNGATHKAYWIRFDNNPRLHHLEQRLLKPVENGQTQKENIQPKI
jgi:hypothetical protein